MSCQQFYKFSVNPINFPRCIKQTEKARDHLICNHFSRKVQKSGSRNLVREIWFEKNGSSWIFFLVREKWLTREKKVGSYYKSIFFSGWRKAVVQTRIFFLVLDKWFKTLFQNHFSEKWLQIKWPKEKNLPPPLLLHTDTINQKYI